MEADGRELHLINDDYQTRSFHEEESQSVFLAFIIKTDESR